MDPFGCLICLIIPNKPHNGKIIKVLAVHTKQLPVVDVGKKLLFGMRSRSLMTHTFSAKCYKQQEGTYKEKS